MQLLGQMGVHLTIDEIMNIEVNSSTITKYEAPYDLVKTMRASILVLGPLLSRFGEAHVSFPGGCAIGTRPVDIHLDALIKMGANIQIESGYIHAKASRLKGCKLVLEKVTVTGTENLLMAAVLADGTTIIENAAKEPEVSDLAHFLNVMGAKITGIDTDILTIEGVQKVYEKNKH
jgi:UDP-N-acetylglucosamine 1-carboxyvinyltransferase